MKFTSFIGNEKIKEQLSVLLEAQRLPHALILEGEEGLGKRTLARELALALVCRAEDKPCRACAQCRKVLGGYHPDVIEYTAPNKPAGFHVDKVREIRDDAFTTPNEADYKIYILGNAQSMNRNAQNALLKVLEEPPAYAVFILCVTNKSALLETVLSRSVVMSLEGVAPAEGAEFICAGNEDITYDDALAACEIFSGNIGKALASLTEGKLAEIGNISRRMAEALLKENEYELLKVCAVFQRDNETLLSALSVLKAVFRDALTGGKDSMSGQRDSASLLASRISKDKLLKLMNVCDEISRLAKGNVNNNMIMTKLCYDLRRAIGR